MVSKTHALVLILALSLGLSYLAEAHDEPNLPETAMPIPVGAPSPSNNIGVESTAAAVAKLRERIPKGEEFIKVMKKRIDETPTSSPAEQCLDSCMPIFEKEIANLKKFTEALASNSKPSEMDYDTSYDRAELTKCNGCIGDVAEEDPEFKKLCADWISTMTKTPEVEELNNKFNS